MGINIIPNCRKTIIGRNEKVYFGAVEQKMRRIIKASLVLVVSAMVLSVVFLSGLFRNKGDPKELVTGETPEIDKRDRDDLKTATFSLGCFWGPDAKFGALPGVVRTRVGYAGGAKENPTYHDLGGHTETIQIDYDPSEITYEELLDVFWNSHDPTLTQKTQYKSIIFYHQGQEATARGSLQQEEAELNTQVATEIKEYSKFYIAEDYHQKYHLRQKDQLFKAYELVYPTTGKLVDSTAVARVNGYVTGHGEIETQEDLTGLGLTEKGKEKLYDAWSTANKKGGGDYCDLPS